MIVDALNRLSDAQALTTTANSTYCFDKQVNRDIGAGEPLDVVFNVPTALTGGTSVTISLVESAAAALTSPVTLATGPAILTASLTAGARFAMRIPPQVNGVGLRYFGIVYTISGTYSAGTITADIVPAGVYTDIKYYASGFSVTS